MTKYNVNAPLSHFFTNGRLDSLSRIADPPRPDHPTESFPLHVISPRVPVLGPYLCHRARLCR